jgi:hypothetical protein
MYVVVEQSVTPTNTRPVASLIASSPPQRASHAQPRAGIILWSVQCMAQNREMFVNGVK